MSQAGSDREQRRLAVWDGILRGHSYRRMAAALGVSRQTICRDVKVLQRRWALIAEDIDGHHRRDLARIERLAAALYDQAIDGGKNGTPDKFAVDRFVMLMDRKARHIGYDKPVRTEQKHTIEHTTVLDDAIEELLSQFPQPTPEPENAGQ